jgi:RHS repeat-associated protein
VSNAYDHRHRRIRKETAAGTRLFAYDGWNLTAEVFVDSQTGATNVTRYLWGPDLSGTLQGAGGVGGLLAVIRPDGTFFPCYDANGNVTDYVDAYGTVRGHFVYDAFGNTIALWGDLAHTFRFRFSTKYWDEETCSYYYGYRYYAPELGRWLTRDPLGDEAFVLLNGEISMAIRRRRLPNLSLFNRLTLSRQVGNVDAYLFVLNNSASKVDYLGLDWLRCWGNCIEKERWDWATLFGLVGFEFIGGPLTKAKAEELWMSMGVDEQTSMLSRWSGRIMGLGRKLPLGNAYRSRLMAFGRTLRDFGRTRIGKGASGFASLVVVFEGFYDIGIITTYCPVMCCADPNAY